MMSGTPTKFEGWTLAEAVARTKLPRDSFEQGRNRLWHHLADKRLAAIGTRDRAIEWTRIDPESWANLIAKDWDRSIVQERNTEIEIYNVRLFPVLHSADAPVRMVGHSLSDIFKWWVIEDPEVAALGKQVSSEAALHVPVFRDGQYPGYYVNFNWPLDLNADDLAFHFVKPFFSYVEDPMPGASEAVKGVARTVVDRLQALRALLVDGKVIVRGTFVATGMVGTIDPLQWRRSGLCIEARNGDLFEKENSKLVLRWSGLAVVAPTETLSDPSSVFHMKCTDRAGALAATTKQQARPAGSKALARLETFSTSYKECVAWLAEIMLASPNERTETRQRLWKKAQQKWPGTLSERSFFNARAEAIRITGATAWGAAGASRKSLRRKSPR
jgi:hypothetical protein